MKKIFLLCLVFAVVLTGCGILKSKLPVDSIMDLAKDLSSGQNDTTDSKTSSDEDFAEDPSEGIAYQASDNATLEEMRKTVVSTFNSENSTSESPCTANWNELKNLTVKCKVDNFGVLKMIYPTIAHTATLAFTGLTTLSEVNDDLPEDFVVTVMLTVKNKAVYTARTPKALLEKISNGEAGTQKEWLEEAEIIQ